MAASESDLGYRYFFYSLDGEPLWCGFTARPTSQREGEHRSDLGPGYIETVGRPIMRGEARGWEKQQGCPPWGGFDESDGAAGVGDVARATAPVAICAGVGALLGGKDGAAIGAGIGVGVTLLSLLLD